MRGVGRGGGCKNTFYELMMVSHAHIKMVRAQKEYLNLHGLVLYTFSLKIQASALLIHGHRILNNRVYSYCKYMLVLYISA
jgi:hypothetical protein